MSKIKNGGLDQYGAEPFEREQLRTAGVEGVKTPEMKRIKENVLACKELLLGRVALVAKRPIVIKLSCGRSVGLCVGRSVGRSVCPVYCGKTADRIRMPFGTISRTSAGMSQVVGFGDRPT